MLHDDPKASMHPCPVQRNVILHMHFPKTGGTTLSAILDRELGRRHQKLSFFRSRDSGTDITWNDVWARRHTSDLEPEWDFGESDLRRVLMREGTISAISRHGMVISPSAIEALERGPGRCRILPVFFLRRFLTWHVSLYFQQRRDPEYMVRKSRDPDMVVAKTGTLAEYTRFCVDGRRGGHKPMFNWQASDVARMLARIEMYHVGIMERYDESLVVMEETLGRHFSGLDLSYAVPLNARAGGGGQQARREREIERYLGTDLARGLHEIGARSDDVHARIGAELDSRASQIHDFQGRMDDFKLRCEARRRAAGNTDRH